MANLVDELTYTSKTMGQMYEELLPFVKTATPILFWGEPGSGMGFYARQIHNASRKEGTLLRESCYLVDEQSVKAKLFGNGDEKGWIEEADGGTIFFKRLEETTLEAQKILLKMIGSQSVDGRIEFSGAGKAETLQKNVRFIFSVTKNFSEAIQDKEVLYDFDEVFRKRGRIIHLFPLRERKEDIVTWAEYFLTKLSHEHSQAKPFLGDDAKHLLTNHEWPNNFQGLKGVLSYVFQQFEGEVKISEAHIRKFLENPVTGNSQK